MACLQAPRLPYPDLSLFLPDINIPNPSLTVSFCCTFKTPPIPGLPIVIPIAAILAALGAAGDTVIALLDQIVDLLNSILDQIPPINCPLD